MVPDFEGVGSGIVAITFYSRCYQQNQSYRVPSGCLEGRRSLMVPPQRQEHRWGPWVVASTRAARPSARRLWICGRIRSPDQSGELSHACGGYGGGGGG